MPVEIERKFLVVDDAWREGAVGVHVRQGYLTHGGETVVRVRIAGSGATLTVKGPTTDLVRDEFEYPIPVEDAHQLLAEHCAGRVVHKTRYRVPVGRHTWEIDEFHGRNEGLVVAEVELRERDERVELPPWVGDEVSADPRYANSNLAIRPLPDGAEV